MIKSTTSVLKAANSRERVTGFTHDFYNYPARFSPILIREIISQYTDPGDLVLDPFMGGGTTLIEAKLLNRESIGFDISTLSSFVTNVKVNPLVEAKFPFFNDWMNETINLLNCRKDVVRPEEWISRGYQRNLTGKEVWPIRKIIEQFLHELSLLRISDAEINFFRCVILKTGQWALDSKKRIPTVVQFKDKLISNYFRMQKGSKEFWDMNPVASVTAINSPANKIHSYSKLFGKKPRLVLTSPPYPGVHVVYHRWQVLGKRETPAPFWIANSQDGHGLTHYAMGGRRQIGLIDYYQNIKTSFESVRKVCDSNSTVVQILAFSNIEWQLPKYLETMQEAGYSEITNSKPRIWRDVPNRKWYAQQKGRTSSSQEVILFHKLAR